MSQGYDQFFKKAKETRKPGKKVQKSNASTAETTAEEYLRAALKVKAATKSRTPGTRIPKTAVAVVVAGLCTALLGYFYPERFEHVVSQFEIGILTQAGAAAGSKSEENSAQTPGAETADPAGADKSAAATKCAGNKGFTEEELSHFNKLNDRKKELDLREAELTSLEEELHKQKSEIESRISKLEQIREEVAGVLKDRVEVDQQRVATLVDFYSNMKPKQAADIFATLNEDLAVEVLTKMKKKNAADSLNLLEANKARTLSEKFTGYKRR